MENIEKAVSDCLENVKSVKVALDAEILATSKRLVDLQKARAVLSIDSSSSVQDEKKPVKDKEKSEKTAKAKKSNGHVEEPKKKRGRKSRAELAVDLPKVRKAVYEAFLPDKAETTIEDLVTRSKIDATSIRQQVYLLMEAGFIKRINRGTYAQA